MPGTILILEDLPELADLMSLILQRNGYHVTIAPTLDDARRAWTQNSGFDMLLADAYVPDGSGIDLATELKHHMPNLRVVITTGNLEAPLPPGFDLILKPFNLQLFVKLIDSWFAPANN